MFDQTLTPLLTDFASHLLVLFPTTFFGGTRVVVDFAELLSHRPAAILRAETPGKIA